MLTDNITLKFWNAMFSFFSRYNEWLNSEVELGKADNYRSETLGI